MRALAATLALAGWSAAAQDGLDAFAPADPDQPVSLIADSVEYDETAGTLTASGGVEVYYGDRTITADEIVYDSRADRITARGAVVLRAGEELTAIADFAEVDPALRDGVIRGARASINAGGGALASVEGRRVDGRYTTFSKAVYSSCAVCELSPTPLWRIRARRVIHDDVEKNVHFEDAVVELLGLPVAYAPYLTLPDPRVRRRSGFLPPDVVASSVYGYAARIPYFIAIDPTRDATLTAFPTQEDGPIALGEYRQRFDTGRLDLDASFGVLDTGEDGANEARGHVFGTALFEAPDFEPFAGGELGGALRLSTDDTYRRRYDLGDEDRLLSEAFLRRYGETDFTDIGARYFQTLREDERQDEIPFVLPEFRARRAIEGWNGPGDLAVEASGVGLFRRSGRDVSRATASIDWEATEIVGPGVALRGFALGRGDLYLNEDADDLDGGLGRLVPLAGLDARFPLIALDGENTHLIEPTAVAVITPQGLNSEKIIDEDSLSVEFDEVNLFEANRYPGFDRVEEGARLNLGARYGGDFATGLRVDATFGRVFRFTEDTDFSPGTGLAGRRSDYVGAWRVGLRDAFSLSHRFRVDEDGDVNRNELRGEARLGPLEIAGTYFFLEEDATAGADEDRSEGALEGSLQLNRNLSVRGEIRRDLQNDAMIEAGGAVAFETECAAFEVYAERDFTSVGDSPSSIAVGLRVRLFAEPDGAREKSPLCAPQLSRAP